MDISSFPDIHSASLVLRAWRNYGHSSAIDSLQHEFRYGHSGPLLAELEQRLIYQNLPNILVDGLWFTSLYGGITRVWTNIFSTFSLPGFTSPSSLIILKRGTDFEYPDVCDIIECPFLDPLDYEAVLASSFSTGSLAKSIAFDAFISSSNSFISGMDSSPQIALVHDCIPERIPSSPLPLLQLRSEWIKSCSSFISVSKSTANDLSRFHGVSPSISCWCHPSPSNYFLTSSPLPSYSTSFDIPSPFVLLPSAGSPFSYKNSSLLAKALIHDSLSSLHLVVSGVGSGFAVSEIINHFPSLSDRVTAVGLSDSELVSLYQSSLAVIVPSLFEGFGLTVVEALAQDAVVLCADSPGLREASLHSVPLFSPTNPAQLISLLQLLLENTSSSWFKSLLRPKARRRVSLLNPDLIGLCLATQVRRVAF